MTGYIENPNKHIRKCLKIDNYFVKVSGWMINSETLIIFSNTNNGQLETKTKNTMPYTTVSKNEVFGYKFLKRNRRSIWPNKPIKHWLWLKVSNKI